MKLQTLMRQSLCLLISVLLSLSGLSVPTEAQDKGQPVNISFGQPNIWSLEQAHYLLARLRRQSLDLKSTALTDLNPNEAEGTRLRSLRELLGIGVGFDQQAGLQNQLFERDARFNQERKQILLQRRDQRMVELHDVDNQLSQLRVERERMNADSSTDDSKKLKQTEIEQAVERQSKLNSEITSLTSEINGMQSSATSLVTPTPPDATTSKLADSVVDKLLDDQKFKDQLGGFSPKLNASTMLENYLNLQYEIIAKQLTLLRDEVGPGERLIFLELPQSIYTVPDKANRKLVQVWWHVDGYYEPDEAKREALTRQENKRQEIMREEVKRDNRTQVERVKECEERARQQTGVLTEAMRIRCDCDARAQVNEPSSSGEMSIRCSPYRVDERPMSREEMVKNLSLQNYSQSSDPIKKGNVRTVDLIPRQSALNVNDIQDKVKNFNLAGLFTFLSGFGARVDFQRQRRLFEQFLQQDIYASAFGKGQGDFGWTFGPKPGTERIAPGLHTTFAILIVPEKASMIKLSARGCYFPRTGLAPQSFDDTNESDSATSMASMSNKLTCTPASEFNMQIPGTTDNNFWVTGVDYRQVRNGERAVVFVRGDYFSPQIGVLVDGVPLRRAIGLAQVELAGAKPNDGFEPTPRGDFEFVNSKLLILAFSMGQDYEGTPSIALVTPGRARTINDLRLIINESHKCKSRRDEKFVGCNCKEWSPDGKYCLAFASEYKPLELRGVPEYKSMYVRMENQPALFSKASPATVLGVEGLKLFALPSGQFRAYLSGSKFEEGDDILVNGTPIQMSCTDKDGKTIDCKLAGVVKRECTMNSASVKCPRLITPGVIELEFPATNDPTLEIAVIHNASQGDASYATKTFPNSLAVRVEKISILDFKPKNKPHPLLTVQLEGTGLDSQQGITVTDGSKKLIANIIKKGGTATNLVLGLELLTDDQFLVINLPGPQPSAPIPVVITRPLEQEQTEQNTEEQPAQGQEKPGKPKKPVKPKNKKRSSPQ